MSEEYQVRGPELQRINEAIQRDPATDLADLAAKVIVLSGGGIYDLPDAVGLEGAQIVE